MRVGVPSPEHRSTRHRGRFAFLTIVVCALVPSLAPAANINIVDLTDSLSIAGTQFEFGFSATVTNPTETITFQGSWISNGGTSGSGIFYLVEPGTTIVSDILRVSFECASPTGCQASINGTFISDVTGTLGPLPAGFTGVAETGALQNVTGLFQNPANGAPVTLPANLTIFVQSDVNETGEVPEPSSISLLIGGLMLVGIRFVQRRSSLR
jgi:hypothetical protein